MKNIINAVEKHKQLILDSERFIWEHPETGYKEIKTNEYMINTFKSLGYELKEADGITGFYTEIDTGKEGPCVLILAELDAIICPEHKDADKDTGAVHSCGHNAQCAALVGIAAALKEKGITDTLSGKIRLCAVPAEELLELEYRASLKKKGIIKYFGGKSEFLHRGYFDGVDMAFMVHTARDFCSYDGMVGCIAKNIVYKGTAAHAGSTPWLGRNALYAANLGLNAINAIRETFKEEDIIRVHPIITEGGQMVNAIPAEVRMESYVRGASLKAISDANKRVNRALVGAALSIGANIDIIDIPGYSPLNNCADMVDIAKCAAEQLGIDFEICKGTLSGSTDMGDLSTFMPVMHPYCAGNDGTPHGKDYRIVDPIAACVTNAKWQLLILKMLLENGAVRAKEIIKNYKGVFASKEEFLAYQDSINCSGERIEYDEENGTANIKIF